MRLGDKCESAIWIPVFFLWRLASLSSFWECLVLAGRCSDAFPAFRFTFARLPSNVLRPVVVEETGIVLFRVAHRLPLDLCAVRHYNSKKKRWPKDEY